MLGPDQCGSALGDSEFAFLLHGETTKYILKDTHRGKLSPIEKRVKGLAFTFVCVCVFIA